MTQTDYMDLFHISNHPKHLRDFMRTGAQACGQGVGGQSNGFYVWTTRAAAERHFVFKDKITERRQKSAFGPEGGLLVHVRVPRSDIRYPAWQFDIEGAYCLEDLWFRHRFFLNEHAKNLALPVCTTVPAWRDCKMITGFSYCFLQNEPGGPCIVADTIGWDEKPGKKYLPLGRFDATVQDTVKGQLLTDYLCRTSPDFLRDYHKLLDNILNVRSGTSLKYTGRIPLPVAGIEHISGNAAGACRTTPVYMAHQRQVCPFLLSGLAQHDRD